MVLPVITTGAPSRSPCILLPTQLLQVCFAAESWHLPPSQDCPLGMGTILPIWRAKKMPRFLFPHAHLRVGCSQWLMGVEVQKPNSCFSRCNLHFLAPHRIRLSLGVQLKSLVLGFFLFPILLLQFPYWLIPRVVPLINHLDPNVAQGLVWGETKLRQLCCFLSPEYQSPSCLPRATLLGGDETRERLSSQPWA